MPLLTISLWLFLGFIVLAYLVVPPFIQVLREQLPVTFDQLGQPSFKSIFSRDPGNWKTQFRLLGFVLSGKAFVQTRENSRILACFVFMAYLGVLVSLSLLIYAVSENPKHTARAQELTKVANLPTPMNNCNEKTVTNMNHFQTSDRSDVVDIALRNMKSKFSIFKNEELLAPDELKSVKGPFEIIIVGEDEGGFLNPVKRREDIALHFNELNVLIKKECYVVLTGP
jgi:hypothetical protein